MIRKSIDCLESSLQGGRFEKRKRKELMRMKGRNKIFPQISILGMDCKFIFLCGNMSQIGLVLTTSPHNSLYFTVKETKTLKVNSTSKVTQIKSERLKVLKSV